MPNAGLAAMTSVPTLAVWAALFWAGASGCGAPDLTFADEIGDGASSVDLPDAPSSGPRYLGGGGTVTASYAGIGIEDMTHAWDNDTTTKWFARATTPWTAYKLAGGASHLLTWYTVTSGNDYPYRDPKSWRLEGSNDGSTWSTVDTQINQVFAGRNQKSAYNVASSTPYGSYRFNVTANSGGPDFQVAEIQLFGY
jgi:hypothetical protein